MFGLQLEPMQMIGLCVSVLTAALSAFTGITMRFVRVLKEERIRAETQSDKFISAISTQNKEFRDLTYRIVEQRDKDIQRTVEALTANSAALKDMQTVCSRLDHHLIARNGAMS